MKIKHISILVCILGAVVTASLQIGEAKQNIKTNEKGISEMKDAWSDVREQQNKMYELMLDIKDEINRDR